MTSGDNAAVHAPTQPASVDAEVDALASEVLTLAIQRLVLGDLPWTISASRFARRGRARSDGTARAAA